jgi:arylformamidase
VFVHGGYWRTMDKSDFSFLALPLVSRGITVVMPNYPFCPDAGIGDIVAATRRMLRWVSENIGRYGGDSSHVHLAGWSAGAHLVTMLLTSAADGAGQGPASVLAISGIYDLRLLKHVRANEDLRITDGVAQANSPALLTPARKARLAIVIGALETLAIHEQASALVSAWRSELPELTTATIAAAHHYSMVSRLADESSELFALALEVMGHRAEKRLRDTAR